MPMAHAGVAETFFEDLVARVADAAALHCSPGTGLDESDVLQEFDADVGVTQEKLASAEAVVLCHLLELFGKITKREQNRVIAFEPLHTIVSQAAHDNRDFLRALTLSNVEAAAENDAGFRTDLLQLVHSVSAPNVSLLNSRHVASVLYTMVVARDRRALQKGMRADEILSAAAFVEWTLLCQEELDDRRCSSSSVSSGCGRSLQFGSAESFLGRFGRTLLRTMSPIEAASGGAETTYARVDVHVAATHIAALIRGSAPESSLPVALGASADASVSAVDNGAPLSSVLGLVCATARVTLLRTQGSRPAGESGAHEGGTVASDLPSFSCTTTTSYDLSRCEPALVGALQRFRTRELCSLTARRERALLSLTHGQAYTHTRLRAGDMVAVEDAWPNDGPLPGGASAVEVLQSQMFGDGLLLPQGASSSDAPPAVAAVIGSFADGAPSLLQPPLQRGLRVASIATESVLFDRMCGSAESGSSNGLRVHDVIVGRIIAPDSIVPPVLDPVGWDQPLLVSWLRSAAEEGTSLVLCVARPRLLSTLQDVLTGSVLSAGVNRPALQSFSYPLSPVISDRDLRPGDDGEGLAIPDSTLLTGCEAASFGGPVAYDGLTGEYKGYRPCGSVSIDPALREWQHGTGAGAGDGAFIPGSAFGWICGGDTECGLAHGASANLATISNIPLFSPDVSSGAGKRHVPTKVGSTNRIKRMRSLSSVSALSIGSAVAHRPQLEPPSETVCPAEVPRDHSFSEASYEFVATAEDVAIDSPGGTSLMWSLSALDCSLQLALLAALKQERASRLSLESIVIARGGNQEFAQLGTISRKDIVIACIRLVHRLSCLTVLPAAVAEKSINEMDLDGQAAVDLAQPLDAGVAAISDEPPSSMQSRLVEPRVCLGSLRTSSICTVLSSIGLSGSGEPAQMLQRLSSFFKHAAAGASGARVSLVQSQCSPAAGVSIGLDDAKPDVDAALFEVSLVTSGEAAEIDELSESCTAVDEVSLPPESVELERVITASFLPDDFQRWDQAHVNAAVASRGPFLVPPCSTMGSRGTFLVAPETVSGIGSLHISTSPAAALSDPVSADAHSVVPSPSVAISTEATFKPTLLVGPRPRGRPRLSPQSLSSAALASAPTAVPGQSAAKSTEDVAPAAGRSKTVKRDKKKVKKSVMAPRAGGTLRVPPHKPNPATDRIAYESLNVAACASYSCSVVESAAPVPIDAKETGNGLPVGTQTHRASCASLSCALASSSAAQRVLLAQLVPTLVVSRDLGVHQGIGVVAPAWPLLICTRVTDPRTTASRALLDVAVMQPNLMAPLTVAGGDVIAAGAPSAVAGGDAATVAGAPSGTSASFSVPAPAAAYTVEALFAASRSVRAAWDALDAAAAAAAVAGREEDAAAAAAAAAAAVGENGAAVPYSLPAPVPCLRRYLQEVHAAVAPLLARCPPQSTQASMTLLRRAHCIGAALDQALLAAAVADCRGALLPLLSVDLLQRGARAEPQQLSRLVSALELAALPLVLTHVGRSMLSALPKSQLQLSVARIVFPVSHSVTSAAVGGSVSPSEPIERDGAFETIATGIATADLRHVNLRSLVAAPPTEKAGAGSPAVAAELGRVEKLLRHPSLLSLATVGNRVDAAMVSRAAYLLRGSVQSSTSAGAASIVSQLDAIVAEAEAASRGVVTASANTTEIAAALPSPAAIDHVLALGGKKLSPASARAPPPAVVCTLTEQLTTAHLAAAAVRHPWLGRYLRSHRPFVMQYRRWGDNGSSPVAAMPRAAEEEGKEGEGEGEASCTPALRLEQLGAFDVLQRSMAAYAAASPAAEAGALEALSLLSLPASVAAGEPSLLAEAEGHPPPHPHLAPPPLPLFSLPAHAPLPLASLLHPLLYRLACRLLLAAAPAAGVPAALFSRRVGALVVRVHAAAVEEAARRRIAALVSECLARGFVRLAQIVGCWLPHYRCAGGGGAAAAAAACASQRPPLRPFRFPVREALHTRASGPGDDPLLPDAVIAATVAALLAGTDEEAAESSGGGGGGAAVDAGAGGSAPADAAAALAAEGAAAAVRPLATWPLPLPLSWDAVRNFILPLPLPCRGGGVVARAAASSHSGNVAAAAAAAAAAAEGAAAPAAREAAAAAAARVGGVDAPPLMRVDGLWTPRLPPLPRFGERVDAPLLAADLLLHRSSSGGGGSGGAPPAIGGGSSHHRGALRLVHALQQYVVGGVCRTPLGQALCSPAAVLQHATGLAGLLAAQPAIAPVHKELQDPLTGLAQGAGALSLGSALAAAADYCSPR